MIDIALQPKQVELKRLVDAKGEGAATWLGYGGARGGAKSGAARRVMLARRLELAGTTGFIIRRNFPDLWENHLIKFQSEFPELSQYYSTTHREYNLPNGSRIAFRYADTTKEVMQISRGPEAMDIFVDQAEQFTEEELIWLHTPNRWTGPQSGPGVCKTVLFFNPGGPGTDLLRRIFWKKEYRGEERAHSYSFLQAYGWDNFEWFRNEVSISQHEFYAMPNDARFQMFITQTSEGRKMNALPAALRVGELLGSFESFAGQYFAGVWDEAKVVLDVSRAERLVQPWWTRWMATDWGFAHYAVNLWFAAGKVSPQQLRDVLDIDSDQALNVVVVYRELTCNQTAEADLAARIVEMTPHAERRKIARHFMSPDAWAKRGSANTVAEQIEPILTSSGLPGLDRADDDRIGGWRLLYDGFRRACQVHSEEESESREFPVLLISANCPEVVSAIPILVRDPKKLEDVLKVPGPLYDDVGDALRYGYKSMLDPHSKAPREVRAKEVYDSISGETDDAMTERAMAMLKFNHDNPPMQRLGRPRWRQAER